MTESRMPAMPLRRARPQDRDAIVALLRDAGLPFDDVRPALPQFFVAVDGARVAGAVALEIFGAEALLRSLVVAAPFRGRGIGAELTGEVVRQARAGHVKRLYLLTMTAADFFAGHGFAPAARTEAPATIRGHRQFTSLCPASAILMRRDV